MRGFLGLLILRRAVGAGLRGRSLSVAADQAADSVSAGGDHRSVRADRGRGAARQARSSRSWSRTSPAPTALLGLRELLKADPDGYTLMVGNVGSLVLNYAMDAKAAFDPMKDMVPIAGTAEYATTMVVNKNMPVNSVKEFIAYAKARQGQLTYGSTGEGSMANLSTQLFMQTDRREDGARALQGRAAGAQRPDRGPHPAHHRGVAGGERAGARRHDQGLRGIEPLPPADAAERADLRGGRRAGRRRHRLARHLRPAGTARTTCGTSSARRSSRSSRIPRSQKKLRAIGFEPTGQGVKPNSPPTTPPR